MNQIFPHNFNYLYYIVETSRMQMSPARILTNTFLQTFKNHYNPIYNTDFGRSFTACFEIAERITRRYKKPEFGITQCTINGIHYKVEQNTVLSKAFCNLLHFKKIGLKEKQPKLLIIAPMAGHHATLLKSTVSDMLNFADIYITDWIDANQVPLEMGRFDMDDFIEYVIKFIKTLGPNLHVVAVCQPTVPVMAACAIMSSEKDPMLPKSMILMGGPIDARKNPTSVNEFATARDIGWFEQMLITSVPNNYPGYMRKVYPGFLQLAGFIGMNMQKHVTSHIDLFKNLLIEDDHKAETQKKFYDEFLSVMDLPAEFYIQTIKEVFQNFSLAKGTLVSRNRKINLQSIKNCALFGIEGENDDIASVGQTKAALSLCSSIPEDQKQYYMQKGVGHYGVFSGSKFREFIAPKIKDFVYKLEFSDK